MGFNRRKIPKQTTQKPNRRGEEIIPLSLARKGQAGFARVRLCFNLSCETGRGIKAFPVKAQECFSILVS